MTSCAYKIFARAIIDRQQIVCTYDGHRRELCPVILGYSAGQEKALTFQFGGQSRSGLPPGGEWRCLFLAKVGDVRLRDGMWLTGDSHKQPQGCVEVVDLDVNPKSPYEPKRRLSRLTVRGPFEILGDYVLAKHRRTKPMLGRGTFRESAFNARIKWNPLSGPRWSFKGECFCTVPNMPSDPWRLPMQELMLRDADKRAAHYREQAASLREMGRLEPEGKSRSDILELAAKYDELARQVDGKRSR